MSDKMDDICHDLCCKDYQLAPEEYQDIVDFFSENDISVDLPNSNFDHAKILIKKIIEKSNDYVEIVTGSLPELFLKAICGEIKSAADRGVDVSILIVDADKENKRIKDLNDSSENIHIFRVDEDFVSESTWDMFMHFCISDAIRYRVEQKHEKKDFNTDKRVRAFANFNSSEFALKLHDLFKSSMNYSLVTAF